MKKIVILLFFCILPLSSYAQDYNKVALVSVSSAYDEQSIPYVISALENKGYKVTTKYLDQTPSDLGYVNVEQVRAGNLIAAMKDDDIEVIWFVRGGAGAVNILPYLKQHVDIIKKSTAKILVGFSDVTAIHSFVNKWLGWKSIHGVVAAFNKDVYALEFNDDKETHDVNKFEEIPNINEIMKNGVKYNRLLPLGKKVSVRGVTIGGNLTLMESIIATPYQQDFLDKILILEDTGDSYRHLDRTLHHLLMMKGIKNVSAIIFGQFYPQNATDAERLIYKTALVSFAKQFPKPVYLFPYFGHGNRNAPMILNGMTKISCTKANYYCEMTDK